MQKSCKKYLVTSFLFKMFLCFVTLRINNAAVVSLVHRSVQENKKSKNVINNVIKTSYQQIYFGTDLARLNHEKKIKFQDMMEIYAGYNLSNSALNISCAVISQGPIRLRKNPRVQERKRTRGKATLRNLRNRKNLEDINSIKCSKNNDASLTLRFEIAWITNEDLNLENYKEYYEQFMESKKGKISIVEDLQELGICANKVKGFHEVGVLLQTISPTHNHTFIPTALSIISSSSPGTVSNTTNETTFSPTANLSSVYLSSRPSYLNETMVPTMNYSLPNILTNVTNKTTFSPTANRSSVYLSSRPSYLNETMVPTMNYSLPNIVPNITNRTTFSPTANRSSVYLSSRPSYLNETIAPTLLMTPSLTFFSTFNYSNTNKISFSPTSNNSFMRHSPKPSHVNETLVPTNLTNLNATSSMVPELRKITMIPTFFSNLSYSITFSPVANITYMPTTPNVSNPSHHTYMPSSNFENFTSLTAANDS